VKKTKQVDSKTNLSKVLCCENLMAKPQTSRQWLNCNNVSKKPKLRKTGHDQSNKIVWERFLHLEISETVVKEQAQRVAEVLGKSKFMAFNK
jgi:hypothetical protein